eukprot:6313903-Pyramimonas_sp.AAC.1
MSTFRSWAPNGLWQTSLDVLVERWPVATRGWSLCLQKRKHFIASPLELAEDLSSNWAGLLFSRKFPTTSLGTDAHASRQRVMTTASKRVKKGFRHSYKLQKFKSAGAKVGGIQRAGPLATA